MRILLVDDEPDVLDMLQILIGLEFPEVQFATATNGKEGIDKLKELGTVDIIFSDYNMPSKNGGVFFKEVRSDFGEIPFMLVTSENPEKHSEFKNAKNFHHIEKPFSDKILYSKISLIKSGAGADAPKNHSYIGLDLDIVRRIGKMETCLYLKISNDKFVKVIHAETEFTDSDYERFKNKNIEELFVEKIEFENFIKNFRKKVFSKMAWEKASKEDKITVISEDLALIQKASKLFGWSNQIIEMAHENISNVINVLKEEKLFSSVLARLTTKKELNLTSHSILLAIILTDLSLKMGWSNAKTAEKLTFAAILHDMTIDEDQFADKMTLLLSDDLKLLKENPIGNKILTHPIEAAELTLNWPMCPPDVDIIIRQHHEKPDGTGFPLGLPSFKISPLSAAFIICEDLVYKSQLDTAVDLQSYLSLKSEEYNKEPFKQLYTKVLEMVSN